MAREYGVEELARGQRDWSGGLQWTVGIAGAYEEALPSTEISVGNVLSNAEAEMISSQNRQFPFED